MSIRRFASAPCTWGVWERTVDRDDLIAPERMLATVRDQVTGVWTSWDSTNVACALAIFVSSAKTRFARALASGIFARPNMVSMYF